MTLNKCTKSDIQKSLNLPADPTTSTVDFLFAFDPKKEISDSWFNDYFKLFTCIPHENKAQIIARYMKTLIEKGHNKFVNRFGEHLKKYLNENHEPQLKQLADLLNTYVDVNDPNDQALLRAHFIGRFGSGQKNPFEKSVRFYDEKGHVAYTYSYRGSLSYNNHDRSEETRWIKYDKTPVPSATSHQNQTRHTQNDNLESAEQINENEMQEGHVYTFELDPNDIEAMKDDIANFINEDDVDLFMNYVKNYFHRH